MNIQDLGALGEPIGSVAVLATLIYLTLRSPDESEKQLCTSSIVSDSAPLEPEPVLTLGRPSTTCHPTTPKPSPSMLSTSTLSLGGFRLDYGRRPRRWEQLLGLPRCAGLRRERYHRIPCSPQAMSGC